MSSITIRHATRDDVPAAAAVYLEGYSNTPGYRATYPEHLRVKPGKEDKLGDNIAKLYKKLDEADPSIHVILAVDGHDAGKGTPIVGCAEWRAPVGTPTQKDPRQEEQQHNRDNQEPSLPSHVDKEAVARGNEEIKRLLSSADCVRAFEGKHRDNMWISRDAQRRGIGRQLAQWGIDQADERGDDMWLIALPAGKGLYERLGFKVVAVGPRFEEPQYVMTRFRDEGLI